MEAELKELRALIDRLLKECDINETQIQARKTTNMTLRRKFYGIRRHYKELEKECKQKESIIEFTKNRPKYRDALNSIGSKTEVTSLHERSGTDHLTTLSLREELAVEQKLMQH